MESSSRNETLRLVFSLDFWFIVGEKMNPLRGFLGEERDFEWIPLVSLEELLKYGFEGDDLHPILKKKSKNNIINCLFFERNWNR